MKLKIVEREPITDSWTIDDVARKYTPQHWEKVFESAQNEIKDISDLLEEDKINGRRLPNNCDLFRAFCLTPLHKVRVVLLAQDPFHTVLEDGSPQATGVAFSTRRTAPVQPSTKNIYKELQNTVPGFKTPSHGDLTSWCTQGVFLLNACLTVRIGEPSSHKSVWESFIKKVINAILGANPHVIFVGWGQNAQKVIKKFVGERATVLEAGHPSPMSCKSFFGCNHFNLINEILISKKSIPIDWNVY